MAKGLSLPRVAPTSADTGAGFFLELIDIHRMLDQTHDPFADFINALAADVIDFVAAGSFEEFKGPIASMSSSNTPI